jgi:hypothetical protein
MGPNYIEDMGPRKGYKAKSNPLNLQILNDLKNKGHPLELNDLEQVRFLKILNKDFRDYLKGVNIEKEFLEHGLVNLLDQIYISLSLLALEIWWLRYKKNKKFPNRTMRVYFNQLKLSGDDMKLYIKCINMFEGISDDNLYSLSFLAPKIIRDTFDNINKRMVNLMDPKRRF